MSNVATEAARLMNMLPESDQKFAFEFIKKLVLAWDPDYTKLTPEEEKRVAAAEADEFVDDSEIDWSKIGQ